jgi:glycosyltransferase involved in cell wall biosynthesis
VKLIWTGSFEPDFNRNRKLSRLLDLMGADVEVIRVPVWGSNRIDLAACGKLAAMGRFLTGIPRLLWRLSRAARPDVYLVSYPGWFDMPLIWIVAKVKGRPIVFDPFISLYDTLVVDRGMYSPSSWVGRMARTSDRLALHLADVVIADTAAHLAYYDSIAAGVLAKGGVVPLGADDAVFHPIEDAVVEPRTILFHGTFVPLQGLMTVIDAAQLLQDEGIRMLIIGDGQDRPAAEQRMIHHGVKNVDLVGLVSLDEIPDHISRATVCLGIFGESEKAGRVVPNKLFECVAMGRPVVTRSSPAVENAFESGEIVMVPPGDPEALAEAVRALLADPERREMIATGGRRRYLEVFHESALTVALIDVLRGAATGKI